MNRTSQNLRYLLWKGRADVNTWSVKVAAWCQCSERQAGLILRGESPTREQAARIAEQFGLTLKTLRETDMVVAAGVSILKENLACLVNGLEHGSKTKLASTIGVHQTTISSWLSGKARPENKNLDALCGYFSLPAGTDLETTRLFLSYPPVGEKARKRWLRDVIANLDAGSLQQVFDSVDAVLQSKMH